MEVPVRLLVGSYLPTSSETGSLTRRIADTVFGMDLGCEIFCACFSQKITVQRFTLEHSNIRKAELSPC